MSDNFYEVATQCFAKAEDLLKPDGSTPHAALHQLSMGLRRIAQGLIQQEQNTERRLDDIAKALRAPR